MGLKNTISIIMGLKPHAKKSVVAMRLEEKRREEKRLHHHSLKWRMVHSAKAEATTDFLARGFNLWY